MPLLRDGLPVRPISYSRLPAQDEVLSKLEALVDDGRLAGNANLDALRTEFPFLLCFDRWLAGPGASLLDKALRSTDTLDPPHAPRHMTIR